MVIDPRHMGGDEGYEFRFSVNGRILTITRIDDDGGWNVDFCLRAFLSTDAIPDFTSTIYTYYGIDGERAPKDVTELNFHPSVRIIKKSAFKYCEFLVRVTIPDSVTRIEQQGFAACHSLRFLRLSINLESIGVAAFYNCYSLEAVFLPPTVTLVSYEVVSNCESLRFCILPDPIEHLGRHVFLGCDRLSRTVRNNLSRVCYSTSVTRQAIHECIHTHGIESATEVDTQQMTALHILCANPHVWLYRYLSAIGSWSCRTARLWRDDSLSVSVQEWHYFLRWQELLFCDCMVVSLHALMFWFSVKYDTTHCNWSIEDVKTPYVW